MKIDWEEGLLLETEVALIIGRQERYGVAFDRGKAVWLIRDLENKKEELYKRIRPYLNLVIVNKETLDKSTNEYSYVKKLTNKDGSPTKSLVNFINSTGYEYDDVQGPFSRIDIEEPSISKRGCVINALLKRGWKPTVFTDAGQPKLVVDGEPVDTLLKVGDFGKDLALWYVYNHRQSQIVGLIDSIRPDGRVTAGMITCGTNTFRATHRGVVNIPRVTSTYGHELRSLFTVAPGRVLVGADASGLELRMLAHHMGDEEYISLVLDGDVHTFNMNAMNVDAIVKKTKQIPDRNTCKTITYGIL